MTVLIQGTTFLDMFEGDRYFLFAPDQLERAFADWTIHLSRGGEFQGPSSTVKRFCTVIARKAARR